MPRYSFHTLLVYGNGCHDNLKIDTQYQQKLSLNCLIKSIQFVSFINLGLKLAQVVRDFSLANRPENKSGRSPVIRNNMQFKLQSQLYAQLDSHQITRMSNKTFKSSSPGQKMQGLCVWFCVAG